MSKSTKKRLSASAAIAALTAVRGELSPYIEYLRFPRYRSLEPFTRIDFTFPFTVLIGKNGTNKSSVLHALRGSTRGNSVEEFWFETAVDKIEYEKGGLRQSVIHGYFPAGETVLKEVLKCRFKRAENPDYWEAAKPYRKYGMNPALPRTPPVDMPVVYLDFRAELSSFDKFFYFPDEYRLARAHKRHQKRRQQKKRAKHRRARRYSKQDYIRARSPRIRSVMSRIAAHQEATKRDVAEATLLTEEELDALRWITDKRYTEGKFLFHKIYGGMFGKTIVFHTKRLGDYTEAFAGSGEFAVGALVHEILRAKDHSLVLLDEPETSLHPTAQRRLRDFLLDQAVKKRLQIVLSTHSPQFATDLPDEAIKVFEADSAGVVHVRPSATPREAFFQVEAPAPETLEIVVEDEKAEILTKACISRFFKDVQKTIHVSARPGGVSAIYRDIETYAREKRPNVFVLLDGDQNRGPDSLVDPADLPPSRRSKKELDKLVRTLVEQDLSFAGDPVEGRVAFLEFFYRQVGYLPDLYPERLVWNDSFSEEFIRQHLEHAEARKEAERLADCTCTAGQKCTCYKEKYRRIAEVVGGAATEDFVYRAFVNCFISANGQECEEIRDIIAAVRKGRLR